MRGSIQKKGKSYYIVFRIPDPKTGKKKLKWVPAGQTKKEADIKLNELMGEVHNGTYRELKKATFAEFAELWLNSYAKTKTKPSTFKSYQDIINKHMIPVMGDYYLSELDTGRLQRYVAMRLQSVKPKTVINEIVPLKKMFKHAVLWGYLKINYAECVERPRVEKEEMDIFSPEEINLFLNHVATKFKPFFLTAVLTGMRRGELIGLQWGDIDWNHKQIHVRRAFCNTSKKSISPKSKSSVRRIDLTPSLVSALKRHKLACPLSEDDLVFCTSKGTPFDPDSIVKREYLPALRRAGLRKIRFHDLRHSNVALRIEEGQNIKYIQNQVGHASIQTTLDRYGHLIKEVNQEQAMKLDSALGFVEDSDSSLDCVRRTLEAANKKGLAVVANP
ncbi:MAG: site-specific integrase [Deltaproteobacteria bacterium]|nr:site-specific integrase [Deltaproteobacteria bacterium]